MKTVSSQIKIEAPAKRVWEVLTDQAAFPRWNPFITHFEGELRPGATIRVTIHPPGGKAMTFRPRVLAAVPERELKWLGKLLVGGVFDGEHHFWIEPDDGGVILHQEETFRGVLVPFTGSLLERTLRGFQLMNEALKARAEARPAPVG